jgi:hypothetical protein
MEGRPGGKHDAIEPQGNAAKFPSLAHRVIAHQHVQAGALGQFLDDLDVLFQTIGRIIRVPNSQRFACVRQATAWRLAERIPFPELKKSGFRSDPNFNFCFQILDLPRQ